MKLFLFFASIFLVSSIAFCQNVETVLKKMNDAYASTKSLEYNSVYELYKGPQASEIHSSYTGYTFKSGNKVYQKINNSEFIYSDNFFLKVSHSEKAMVIDKPQRNTNIDVNLETILKDCSEKVIEKKKGYYSIKLVFKHTSQSPYSVVYLRVDLSTYLLEQIDFYFSNLQDFSTEINKVDEARPHLKIKFTETNLSPKQKPKLFSLDSYIHTKNNMLIPTGSCLGYELIDNRI